ncbi:TPA: hypothetical protein M4219_005062 [Klebsiella pneumoniae]|uniref:hypothetical protein n=1 Tax=Klebsiella pneumoniae TaxID=573 RepID=UPI00236AD62C|nr:hypothetical protein [Klebsiella pneumoniae]HCC2946136.1 hypothetical protein [Klebsiella pneumoniae]HDK5994144.1 hypothetical protein [Klebsiella pneumoniae]
MTKITERGMIFNAEMVRALLSGRKTQTRRIIKPQPEATLSGSLSGKWLSRPLNGLLLPKIEDIAIHCPFGVVGDRIWVRETWAILGNEDGCCIDWEEKLCKADERSAARIYRASCEQRPGNYGLWSIPDDADWKPHTKDYQYEGAWRPSIHMPRWASRILLEITGVRVERLRSMSQDDARAEGVIAASGPMEAGLAFRELWDSIYGEESWKANPWVWVIEFKRVEGGAA